MFRSKRGSVLKELVIPQYLHATAYGTFVSLYQRAPPSFIDEAVKKILDRDVGDVAHDPPRPAPLTGPLDQSRATPVNGHPDHPLAVDERRSSPPGPLLATPLAVPLAATPCKAATPLPAANRTLLLQVGKLELRLISPDQEWWNPPTMYRIFI